MSSRNHIKMQKIVIFVKKIEDKLAKNKKCCKVTDHSHYTGKNRGAAHSLCNLKHSEPKEILIVFFFTMDLTMTIILS